MLKANALRVRINPNLVAYYHNPEHLEKIEANDFKAKQQQIEALGFIYEDVTNSDSHLNWFYKKDLSEYQSYVEVFDSFERETKRLINQSLKMPLTIKSLDQDNFKPLIDLLAMTAKENNFTIRSDNYYQTLYASFKEYADIEFNVVELDVSLYRKQLNDEVLKLETKIAADKDNDSRRARNRINQNQDVLNGVKRRLESLISIKEDTLSIAGGVFLILDNELVYLYGGSNPEYHNFYGAQYLQNQMIKKAYELNITTYNFYGTRGSFCNRPNEDGVYFFKRGFNGQLIENFGFFVYEPTNFSSKFFNKIIKIVRKLR